MQYDRFGDAITTEDLKISDIEKSELASFIENNNERYLEIFKKNEDKKYFLHMNWAAMFLSIYWMFYRRMFKEGAMFMLAMFIFSCVIFSVGITAMKDDIFAISDLEKSTMSFSSQNVTENFTDISGEFFKNNTMLNKMKSELNTKLFLYIVLPFIIFSLIFGLIADCLYRNYIFKNIKHSDGGVSKGAILGALGLMVIYNFSTDIVQKIIIKLLI